MLTDNVKVGHYYTGNGKFLGRADDGLGEGLFDSVGWAFEVHVRQPDRPEITCAMLYGNDDAPERIEFYSVNDNTRLPDLVWTPDAE